MYGRSRDGRSGWKHRVREMLGESRLEGGGGSLGLFQLGSVGGEGRGGFEGAVLVSSANDPPFSFKCPPSVRDSELEPEQELERQCMERKERRKEAAAF